MDRMKGREFVRRAVALALGAWAVSGPSAGAQGVNPGAEVAAQPGPRLPGFGIFGFGPDAGFPGFGLRYHPGIGYGGDGLGVPPGGGYPGYGGPGYPHPAPPLRRLGPELPFLYFGGSGPNCPPRPNELAGVGPLVVDPQVAVVSDSPDLGFGGNTGARPYPDTFFAPNAAATTATRSPDGSMPFYTPAAPEVPVPGVNPDLPSPPDSPAPGDIPRSGARGRDLGIDDEAVVGADGVRGLKVSRVHPGTAAAEAGLRVGDVIRSINGYFTAERGNLTWIIAHAAPDGVLMMNLRAESDGKGRDVTARLPVVPPSATR